MARSGTARIGPQHRAERAHAAPGRGPGAPGDRAEIAFDACDRSSPRVAALSPMPSIPFVVALPLFAVLAACSGGSGSPPPVAPPLVPSDPVLADSTGIERIVRFSHPSCASHSGVDVVRMPRFDAAVGEFRDDWLFVASGATGVYGALVDDEWRVRAETYWPCTGYGVVWSDVSACRITDQHGRERAYVYYASRGTDLIEITDVTDFPNVVTVRWPIDIGLPVDVRGVHTMRIDAERGLMVLNAVDVVADPLPAPLTPHASPAVFFDLKADPMRPQLLSLFVGPDAGDQTLFDSHFLEVGGRPIWAASIQQPLHGNSSYFAFYDATDPSRMNTAQRLAVFAGPATGTFHNVVSLPPGPDGAPRISAGFEAFAFAAAPGVMISKAAVLDASSLHEGRMPTVIGWLADRNNHGHAVHNPASRMLDFHAHTHDAVPLAHFTGGYFCYECKDGQDSVRMLAHAPISSSEPSAEGGRFHPTMTVPQWPAVYNGGWDVVASPIGDFVSSTDQEASFLVEPTYGFVRQTKTWIAPAGQSPPRIRVVTGIPETGAELRLQVTGLSDNGTARLRVGASVADVPEMSRELGAMWVPARSALYELQAPIIAGKADFTIPAIPGVQSLAFVAWQTDAGIVRKSPATSVRVRPFSRRLAGDASTWIVPDHFEHDGSCCGLK